MDGPGLEFRALETRLWEGTCTIRGPVDAPKFKDYIPPLVLLKRLSDVFEDEITHLAHEFGDDKKALKLVEKDHKPQPSDVLTDVAKPRAVVVNIRLPPLRVYCEELARTEPLPQPSGPAAMARTRASTDPRCGR